MRELLLKLALLAVSLLLVMIAGEVALRIRVGPPVIWLYPQERYLDDQELGYRLAPNQKAFTHDKVFETNSHGIRGPEVPREPRPGVRRLLALGDSQTAGDGLELSGTWPAQLATRLEVIDQSSAWEVLNAGLSGASPWHYVRLLRRLADSYDFDGVVVALYVNDVTPDPATPEAYVVTNTPAHRIIYLLKRSALFTAIWQARRPLMNALRPTGNIERETRIITGEHDELLERGWRDVEGSLREIRDFAREHGMKVWLLVLPRRDQVDGSQLGRSYDERASEIAKRLGIPCVDVLGAMIDAYQTEGKRLFIPWDGHNTAVANRVIARALAPVIAAGR